MARTMTDVLERSIGQMVIQAAQLIAQIESLREENDTLLKENTSLKTPAPAAPSQEG